VLYVMLTGRPPFTGNTTVEILHKQRFGRFDRPKLYVPEIPSWLDDLVVQLLEKDPEKRPPDAYVLSRRLQDVLAKVDLSTKDDRATVVEDRPMFDQTTPHAVLANPAAGATLMRDLVRGEIERQQAPTVLQSVVNNLWVLIALLILVIAGTVWWSQRNAMTPDDQYQAGVELMRRSAGDDWITARDRYFLPLVKSDPERWTEQVQPYLDDIDAYEWESSRKPPRRRGKRLAVRSEPEWILEQVRLDWERGDYDAADVKLTALSNLLKDDPEAKGIRAVVDSWKKTLDELKSDLPNRRAYLESVLERAESLQQTDPDAAQALIDGILTLYASDPSVADLMERARTLNHLKSQENNP
jgi:serine/threonine-protein kinase